jgi:hypothetical protein
LFARFPLPKARHFRPLQRRPPYRLTEFQFMNIVILAAGQGKRMHSNLPKVLHPLAGKAARFARH